MNVPKRLVLRTSAYALDGGTTFLVGTDETERERTIILAQSLFSEVNPYSDHRPGCLYLDDEVVPIRSEHEAALVSVLKSASVSYQPSPEEQAAEHITVSPNALILSDDIKQVMSRKPEENLKALLAQVISRVESPEYVSFAAKVDAANGPR